MKAVIYKEYGSADVLHLEEVSKPQAKSGEVLIKVMAVEATKADCELRSFKFSVTWFWLPLRLVFGIRRPRKTILGIYFSGVIEGVGEDVSRFAVGDDVFGVSGMGMGAYGEFICVPATNTLVKKPANISFAEAAAVPLGGLNALHFMRLAHIQPGDKVLINGAGGSIGLFAVQIAKNMGAEVTAVDSGIKETMLRDLGVTHFIDYTRKNFADGAEKYHVIFDMVANSSYSTAIGALKPQGRYVMGNPRMSDMLRSVLSTKFTDKTVLFAFAAEKQEELLTLRDMLEQGKIAAVVDKVYAPEQAAEAHRRVETEQRIGSVVLSFGESSEP